MKILIIDDEFSARESIKMMVNFKDYGFNTILEADDGSSGLEIITKERPDLIITDMKMPKLDGVSLLQIIEKMDQKFKIIVISGFNDYSYTRTAIRSKVIDYILKPINKEYLIEALKKAVSEIVNEGKRSSKNIEDVNEALAVIGRARNIPDEKEIIRYFDEVLEKDQKLKIMALFKFLNFDELIKNSFGSYTMIVYHKIYVIITNYFESLGCKVYIKLLKEFSELIIIIEPSEDYSQIPVSQKSIDFDNIIKQIKHSFNIDCLAIFTDSESVSENLYKKCRRACMDMNLLGTKRITSLENIDYKYINQLGRYTFLKDEEVITNAIKSNDRGLAEKAIVYLFEKIAMTKSVSIKELEFLCLELLVMCFNLLRVMGLKLNYELLENEKKLNFSMHIFSIEATKNWMRELIEWSCQYVERECRLGSNNLAKEIIKYIDYYYYEDIDLEMLAAKFYVSKDHISRIIKKETGESFIIYLTNIRLEKALVMLKNPTLKLHVIAEKLGFNDVSYFSKVFKKHYNISPNEFRAMNSIS